MAIFLVAVEKWKVFENETVRRAWVVKIKISVSVRLDHSIQTKIGRVLHFSKIYTLVW